MIANTIIPIVYFGTVLVVTIYLITLFSRFVSAHERIAKALEERKL